MTQLRIGRQHRQPLGQQLGVAARHYEPGDHVLHVPGQTLRIGADDGQFHGLRFQCGDAEAFAQAGHDEHIGPAHFSADFGAGHRAEQGDAIEHAQIERGEADGPVLHAGADDA